jgi:predicted nucleic acid-binding protein
VPDNLVLDTSAVMAIVLEEPEANTAEAAIRAALRRGAVLLEPLVVATEVEYLVIRRYGDSGDGYLSRIQAWPTEVIESDEPWRHEAARVKAVGNISFADSWVAALGLLRGAPVLHKDPQFEGVAGLKTIDIRGKK